MRIICSDKARTDPLRSLAEECCNWFEQEGFFACVDFAGRNWHERAFSLGVPGAVSLVSYSVNLLEVQDVDEAGLEDALQAARAAVVSDFSSDPLATPSYIGCEIQCAIFSKDDKRFLGVCEAYTTQAVLPYQPVSDDAANAIVGKGALSIPCEAVVEGTAVLGAVLRQLESGATYLVEGASNYTDVSLPCPPLEKHMLDESLNDVLPAWSAGESSVGDAVGLVLPWEVHRPSGLSGPCSLHIDIPEEGAYAVRILVAPQHVVEEALQQAEASDALARLSAVLMQSSSASSQPQMPYVGGSAIVYSFPEGDWAGWDHYCFRGPAVGLQQALEHSAGTIQLPSVATCRDATGGQWPVLPSHVAWQSEHDALESKEAAESGAGTPQLHDSTDDWGEQPLPSGPFSSIAVLDVAAAVPHGHRAQYALADRESLIALAAEHGIEALPHTGPEMYGLLSGLYLAMGAAAEGHMSAPYAELRLVEAEDAAHVSTQVGELASAGGDWHVVFGDIADLVAARAGDDAGVSVQSTTPSMLALLGRRVSEGEPALVDAALTMSPEAVMAPGGYSSQVQQVLCAVDAGEPLRVQVTLAYTCEASAAIEEAHKAVDARTAALSGAEHSLDAEFSAAGGSGDGMDDVQAHGHFVDDSHGHEGREEQEPTMSSELQQQQDLELAAFMQEEYDMLNAQCSEEERVFEQLTERNMLLQRRLAAYFNIRQSGDDAYGRGDNSDELGVQQSAAQTQEAAQRYRETLEALAAKRAEHADSRDRQQQESLALQKRIEMRKSEAIQISDSLAQWKRTVAQGAVNSITGRPMTKADIGHFQDEESVRDADIERARVKNIKLKTTLEEFTAQLAAKEHLADGLALIDFEQLKIENSTLNEKIEDRNEELHKLRKKTTTTVQVLTHVKEKLQFVAGEAAELKQQLAQLEVQVAERRDRMTSLKAAREMQRSNIEAKKTEQGFAHNDMLAKDFERRKRAMRQLQTELQELKQRHLHMTKVVAAAKTQGLVDTVLR